MNHYDNFSTSEKLDVKQSKFLSNIILKMIEKGNENVVEWKTEPIQKSDESQQTE